MFQFVSPIDKNLLQQKDYETLTCPIKEDEYVKVDGIWRMIAPERQAKFSRFIDEYETVRRSEGRSDSAEMYAQLPYAPADHPLAAMWHQRAASYEAFLNTILIPQETPHTPQNIIDIGSGNGWLANRLAERGHCLAAVDLTVNEFDGLGVHKLYQPPIVSIQAEFDQLPLDNDQFDLAIFNASLHYSADFATTLKEALRVTKPAGTVAVIDTPIYSQKESGLQMVIERERAFEAQHGFKSNSLESQNFLTQSQILLLQDQLNLEIQTHHIVPTFRRGLRRLKTAVRGQRESAEFPILTIQKQMEEKQ